MRVRHRYVPKASVFVYGSHRLIQAVQRLLQDEQYVAVPRTRAVVGERREEKTDLSCCFQSGAALRVISASVTQARICGMI